MAKISISRLLARHFNIDTRLSNAVDRWQAQQPTDLLRASLLPLSDAIPAYERCVDGIKMDNQKHRQLLPQLHYHLGSKLEESELTQQMRSLRIATLVNNKRLFQQLQQTLSLFESQDIPTLVLKGAAVAPLYYPEISCRPMGDYDLLVPENEYERAAIMLKREGWLSKRSDTPLTPYFDCRFVHADGFVHPHLNASIDLHCHITHMACWKGADSAYWFRAVEMQVGDSDTLRLSDTDNLVQVCLHGLIQNYAPPVRWAADAYHIIRGPNSAIDWNLVLQIAEQNFNAPMLLTAFTYLNSALDTDIPESVLKTLANTPTNKPMLQIWSYYLDKPNSATEIIQYTWYRYRLAACKMALVERLKLAPAFFRHSTNASSLPGAAAVAGTKLTFLLFGLRHLLHRRSQD